MASMKRTIAIDAIGDLELAAEGLNSKKVRTGARKGL